MHSVELRRGSSTAPRTRLDAPHRSIRRPFTCPPPNSSTRSPMSTPAHVHAHAHAHSHPQPSTASSNVCVSCYSHCPHVHLLLPRSSTRHLQSSKLQSSARHSGLPLHSTPPRSREPLVRHWSTPTQSHDMHSLTHHSHSSLTTHSRCMHVRNFTEALIGGNKQTLVERHVSAPDSSIPHLVHDT